MTLTKILTMPLLEPHWVSNYNEICKNCTYILRLVNVSSTVFSSTIASPVLSIFQLHVHRSDREVYHKTSHVFSFCFEFCRFSQQLSFRVQFCNAASVDGAFILNVVLLLFCIQRAASITLFTVFWFDIVLWNDKIPVCV